MTVKHPSHPAQTAGMSSEGDTPEARLAAALHAADIGCKYAHYAKDGKACEPSDLDAGHLATAAAILAADPTIARHMALGAAVERLEKQYGYFRLEWDSTTSVMTQGYRFSKPSVTAKASTLTAAIDAALRDPEATE